MADLVDRFRKFGELPSVTDVFGGREAGQKERVSDLEKIVKRWQDRLAQYPKSTKIIEGLAKAQEALAVANAKLQGTLLNEVMNVPLVELPTITKAVKPVITKEQQKEIDDYNQSIVDAEVYWAGAMTASERNARNRLKVIEDTKKALDNLKKAQTGGFYDPAQRGKRQNSLPAELQAIKESLVEVKSPLKEFADSMPTLNQAMESVVVGGMTALEESLVNLVKGTMSVKDAFKSMANSIINDLIRMAIQQSITAPLAQMFGLQASSPSVPLSPRAIGGSVQSGKPYMVGERGAEMFVPNQSGSIIPSNRLGGGGGTVVNQVINITTGVQQTVRAEIMTLMPQIANAAKSAVADAKLRGGSYASALR
jgi:hypothetical protein